MTKEKAIDVFLLTESQYVAPKVVDDYVANVLLEDRLLQEALESLGLKCKKVDWSDGSIDWTSGRVAIFRTTWDYFSRFDVFEPWLNETAKKILFINPAEQIRWNMDKHYLLDLEKRGIPIVPTTFFEPEYDGTLRNAVDSVEWTEMILKPAVAGAARHTYRLNAENCAELESVFKALIAKESMLIQPFVNSVLEEGEVSYMVFGGKYSHAILKKAKEGDFRVQDDFGGSVHDHLASKEEIEFAEAACRACQPTPIYARVDVMVDEKGEMLVSELEMIEPELWFRNNRAAADALAKEVLSQLS